MTKIYSGKHYCLNYQVALLDAGSNDYPSIDDGNVDAVIDDIGIVVMTATDIDILVTVYKGDEEIDGKNVLNGQFKVTGGLTIGNIISSDTAYLNWSSGVMRASVYVNADKSEEVTEVSFVLKSLE